MGYINLIYPVTHVWYINSRPNFMALLLEIEACEKYLDTSYAFDSDSTRFKIAKQSQTGEKPPAPSEVTELWDERIKRIKLASLVYFIAEDEISFYGLHWDFQHYRISRKFNKTDYPLKPRSKPEDRRHNTPKYLLRTTPNFLIGTPLIKRELERLDLKPEILKTRLFLSDCITELHNDRLLHPEDRKKKMGIETNL